MFTKLFHKDVFIPEGVSEVCEQLQKTLTSYIFSNHFQEHLTNQVIEDRSHKYLKDVVVECLNSLVNTQREVFEVELGKDYHFFGKSGWFVTKYCCRIPYNDSQDLVVAIRPQYNKDAIVGNMVVTAWMNHRTDKHFTLDGSKYCSKRDWLSVC